MAKHIQPEQNVINKKADSLQATFFECVHLKNEKHKNP